MAKTSLGKYLDVPTREIVWHVSQERVVYREAERFMRARAMQIADGTARELIWLLEHPALYTAGTSADSKDLLAKDKFPVFKTGRGGEFTYHGPGQRVVYVMLNLRARGGADVRAFVDALQGWIIGTLCAFDLSGEVRPDRVGVWVYENAGHQSRDLKIAAVGIRLMRWVSLHGFSLNVNVDLSHYDGIVPCGIREHGVTSLAAQGIDVSMEIVDQALRASFYDTFGVSTTLATSKDEVRAFA